VDVSSWVENELACLAEFLAEALGVTLTSPATVLSSLRTVSSKGIVGAASTAARTAKKTKSGTDTAARLEYLAKQCGAMGLPLGVTLTPVRVARQDPPSADFPVAQVLGLLPPRTLAVPNLLLYLKARAADVTQPKDVSFLVTACDSPVALRFLLQLLGSVVAFEPALGLSVQCTFTAAVTGYAATLSSAVGVTPGDPALDAAVMAAWAVLGDALQVDPTPFMRSGAWPVDTKHALDLAGASIPTGAFFRGLATGTALPLDSVPRVGTQVSDCVWVAGGVAATVARRISTTGTDTAEHVAEDLSGALAAALRADGRLQPLVATPPVVRKPLGGAPEGAPALVQDLLRAWPDAWNMVQLLGTMGVPEDAVHLAGVLGRVVGPVVTAASRLLDAAMHAPFDPTAVIHASPWGGSNIGTQLLRHMATPGFQLRVLVMALASVPALSAFGGVRAPTPTLVAAVLCSDTAMRTRWTRELDTATVNPPVDALGGKRWHRAFAPPGPGLGPGQGQGLGGGSVPPPPLPLWNVIDTIVTPRVLVTVLAMIRTAVNDNHHVHEMHRATAAALEQLVDGVMGAFTVDEAVRTPTANFLAALLGDDDTTLGTCIKATMLRVLDGILAQAALDNDVAASLAPLVAQGAHVPTDAPAGNAFTIEGPIFQGWATTENDFEDGDAGTTPVDNMSASASASVSASASASASVTAAAYNDATKNGTGMSAVGTPKPALAQPPPVFRDAFDGWLARPLAGRQLQHKVWTMAPLLLGTASDAEAWYKDAAEVCVAYRFRGMAPRGALAPLIEQAWK
jgi:hypothetical protein